MWHTGRERNPVLIKACNQAAHPWRYLVLPVVQNGQKRVAQGRRSSPDSNALLDEKGSDLVDRRCSPRDQARANAMAGLEIELVLCLLAYDTQVWPQACFSNRLGVVVIVLLPLQLILRRKAILPSMPKPTM